MTLPTPILSETCFKAMSISSLSKIGGLMAICIPLLFSSCKKEDPSLGLDLLPAGDILEASFTNDSEIRAWSFLDSAAKSATTSVILGSSLDPVFGKTEASFYAQLRPDNLISDSVFASTFQNATIDSVVLSLVYNASNAYIYGNGQKTQAAQLVKVYQVTESMLGDSASTYKSDKDFAIDNSAPIGEGWIYPNLADSLKVSSSNEPPQVRIKFSSTFATFLKFIASYEGGMKFKDPDTLLSAFKGIYVTAENPNGTENSGCFYYFDMSSGFSGLRMYYSTSTGNDNVFLKVSDKSVCYNRFKHETAKLQTLSDSTVVNKQTCFIQSMQGMKTRLFFPGIKSLAKNKKIAVVDASLIITPSENTYSTFRRPSRITGLKVLANGTLQGPLDAYELSDPTSYGAELQSDGTYVLKLTRYLQNLAKADAIDYGLDLLRPGGSIYADRLVFGGTESLANPMKLKIKYIDLK